MKKADQIRFIILRSIGNFLVLFGLFGALATFGPAIYEEVHYQIDQARGIRYVVGAQSQLGGLSQIKTNEQVLTAPDPTFSVLIPKIGAASRVLPNVDSTNEAAYVAALKKGVAHARGSVFPGLAGTTYLFAHSTDSFWDVGRYNAVFYLLKNLVPGDDIVVFFQDHRFNYKVIDTKIINPSDVDLLVNAQQTQEQLVLQTCWPPGTTLQRLMVIAKPVGKMGN
jgi:LPXTG-site transpeptidase (sortase) family protein